MLVIDRLLYRPRADREPLSLVDEAIEGGVSLVQFRASAAGSDGLETFALAQRLREITRDRVPLIVTDDIQLAEKCHADGVLLSSEFSYRPSAVREYIRQEPAIVGCYAPSVATAAKAERGGADYVQVGPVFAADDPESGVTLLRKIKDAIHLPVVAFGGIATPEQAKLALDSGAEGIALTDAILAADDPRAAASVYASLF